MTEPPATRWWAFPLAVLLLAAPPVLAADRTEAPPETMTASDSRLPGPDLDRSLLKSQRKDGPWRKSGHYAGAAAGPHLKALLLESVLAELALPEVSAEPTIWEEVENWLAAYFGEQADPVLPEWLRSYRLPEDTVLWLFYISCALIVLLALGIVANEIRHARGRRKVSAGESAVGSEVSGNAESVETEPTSLFELPAWLLGRLIARLGLRLSGTRGASLTHRELVRAGQDLPREVAGPLGALARTAERIRYDEEVPAESEVSTAVEQGTALLDSLGAKR